MVEAKPVLQLRDLTVNYGEAQPVKGISFSLNPGEKAGIVGESGSGKSLTALSIMRLARGSTAGGEVLLNDRDLLQLRTRDMVKVRGGRIAMVYQDPMSSLNPVQTIGRQLVEAVRLHESVSKQAARNRAISLLEDVGVPQPRERMAQYPHQFSGGMRQRVMIAMALSAQPEVLIADEPTTALDVTTQARIIGLLDSLAEQHGTAVILITHDLGVAAGFCERIHVMQNGRIVESAEAEQLYRNPQHPYTKGLLRAIVDLTIDPDKAIPTAAQSEDAGSGAFNGSPAFEIAERTVADSAESSRIGKPNEPTTAGDVLVRVDSVSKSFRIGSGEPVKAVDSASFEIRRGETFGLVGESGSGKSTLSRAVLALDEIDEGNVTFDGQDIHALPGKALRQLRRRMQMVFQDPVAALNRRKTVEQLVLAPLEAHRIGTHKSRLQKVDEMMNLVGLAREFAGRLPHTMSGGQCQRVAIARSLVLNPEFLVLDESVSALDVSIQAQVLNLLRELQKQLGLTYLFISHDLAVVRYMAQNIAVMNSGSIVEMGPREQLFSNPRNDYTKALMAAIPVADPEIERARRREAARLVAISEQDDAVKEFAEA